MCDIPAVADGTCGAPHGGKICDIGFSCHERMMAR